MLLMAVAFAVTADAQGFLKRLKDRAVNAAENAVSNKVTNKVTRETDDTIDDAINGTKKIKSNDADYEAPDSGPEAKAGQVLGSNGQFYDTAEAALQQIDERGYAAKYALDGRPVTKVGLTFSSKERNITEWKAK